jgi:hypothetical protein
VKNDYGTEKEDWALNGLEEPLKIKDYLTDTLLKALAKDQMVLNIMN